ncbi:glycosyltransferase family 4 protein [Haladaptatus sp. DFWS20]|uniref:glycosyltransferase family 4 protein n=1 Tax=Haladaptatus sp. DFWS20 TaxID=3403467 RepID=UPI003EBB69F4
MDSSRQKSQSIETTLEEVGRNNRDTDHLQRREEEQLQVPNVGMYYPTAGSFHASGIAMYIQQLIKFHNGNYSPFLYTETGDIADKLQQIDADIIQSNSGRYKKIGGLVKRYLDITDSIPPSILDEKLPLLLKAFQDGILRDADDDLDVLLTHHYFDNIVLSNLLEIPVVHVFHGVQSVGIGMKAWKKLSKSKYIIANSRHTKDIVENELEREVTGIVHPGVDIDQFNPNIASFNDALFDRDEFVILFAGRFVESKGIYDLLEAMDKLPPKFHLYMIGRGDRRKIDEHIQAFDLEDSVTIEDSVAHNTLPQYYTAADVVCSPTHYDSFCMVNVEAMACGTPVVTTDIAGVSEYAIDRETALLAPPNDPNELAGALLELAESPKLWKNLRENGRSMVERYSWGNSSQELHHVCQKIL